MTSQTDQAKYTVGWIAPLPLELAAATAILEDHTTLQVKDDDTLYHVGRIKIHYVVMVVCPRIGTNLAAGVVKKMRNSFKNINHILVVGIAGGVPRYGTNLQEQIVLGDVVISVPQNSEGGVVDYGSGALVGEDKLSVSGHTLHPSTTLLTAVGNLRAVYMQKPGTKIPQFLRDLRSRLTIDELPEFKDPGPENDHLFDDEYPHSDLERSCTDLCNYEKSKSRVNRGNKAIRKEDTPVVHYGTIGSANTLVISSAVRNRLYKERGIICFEMESAGIMSEWQALVIRGICDYADSHKNKTWQKYAAATAAACAKEILLQVPEAEVAGKPTEATPKTKAYEIKFFEPKSSSYKSHKNFNPSRHPGTCLWVLGNNIFRQWRDSDHNDVLWISADPGCGKSVLCRALVDERLAADASIGIYYFFFKENENQNDAKTALCALLHQLFCDYESIFTDVALPFLARHGDGVKYDFESLWELLLLASANSAAQGVVIILDALDECKKEDRELLIRKLSKFYSPRYSVGQPLIKFLLTSRPYESIEIAFFELTRRVPTIRLRGEKETHIISQEVNMVINTKLDAIAEFRGFAPDVKDALHSKLSESPNRTYLWLSLIIEELKKEISSNKETLLEVVEKLPKSVEDAYERILAKCSAENADATRKILQILIAAQRPLTVLDFDYLLAMNDRIKDVHSMRLEGITTRSAQLRQYCGLFVTIVGDFPERAEVDWVPPSVREYARERTEVHWIHQTAREFLVKTSEHNQGTWRHSMDERLCHQLLGSICQDFLLLESVRNHAGNWASLKRLDDYRKESALDTFSLVLTLQRRPLYAYASTYWHHHIRLAIMYSPSPLVDKSIKLCDISNDEYATWAFLWHHDKVFLSHFPEKDLWGNLDHDDRSAGRLYWATALRLEGVVEKLLEMGESPNQTGGDYVTPFVAALFGRNRKILQQMHHRALDIRLQCEALVEVFNRRLDSFEDIHQAVIIVLNRWTVLFPEAAEHKGLKTMRQVFGGMIYSHRQLQDAIQHWLGQRTGGDEGWRIRTKGRINQQWDAIRRLRLGRGQ